MEREFSRLLRQAADWFDANPEVPTPGNRIEFAIHSQNFPDDPKLAIATVMRALGKTSKDAMSDIFWVTGEMVPGVHLTIFADRNQVCTKVVKHKVIPARPAHTVELEARPETVEEEVTWECPDSILADAPQDQASELRAAVAAGT